MKLGLDLHGVLDTHLEVYRTLTNLLIGAGHEVHIVTGVQRESPEATLLEEQGVPWTYWFSTVDYHLELGKHKVWFDAQGHPWMEAGIWDRAKAEYCVRAEIDIMIDDSPIYGQYFQGKTLFLLQRDVKEQEVWKQMASSAR